MHREGTIVETGTGNLQKRRGHCINCIEFLLPSFVFELSVHITASTSEGVLIVIVSHDNFDANYRVHLVSNTNFNMLTNSYRLQIFLL